MADNRGSGITIRCIGYAQRFLVADAIMANTQDKDEVGERRIKDKVVIKADLSALLSQIKAASSKSNTLDIILKDVPEDSGVVAVIEERVPAVRVAKREIINELGVYERNCWDFRRQDCIYPLLELAIKQINRLWWLWLPKKMLISGFGLI